MLIDDVMAAHVVWKVRLRRFVKGGSNERFDSTTTSKDNLCDLGQWIYGEGAKCKSSPHYDELMQKHAQFHLLAAEIVKRMEGDDPVGAAKALNGPFDALSAEIIRLAMKLRESIGKD